MRKLFLFCFSSEYDDVDNEQRQEWGCIFLSSALLSNHNADKTMNHQPVRPKLFGIGWWSLPITIATTALVSHRAVAFSISPTWSSRSIAGVQAPNSHLGLHASTSSSTTATTTPTTNDKSDDNTDTSSTNEKMTSKKSLEKGGCSKLPVTIVI